MAYAAFGEDVAPPSLTIPFVEGEPGVLDLVGTGVDVVDPPSPLRHS